MEEGGVFLYDRVTTGSEKSQFAMKRGTLGGGKATPGAPKEADCHFPEVFIMPFCVSMSEMKLYNKVKRNKVFIPDGTWILRILYMQF